MKNVLPDEVATEISPLLSKLFSWVDKGIAAYLKAHQSTSLIFEKRTKFGMIRDYIVDEIKRDTYGDPHIKTVMKGNLILFIINQRVAFKIKKLNDRFLSSSHKSKQLSMFHSGQLELPGCEGPICLELGYIPDALISGHKGIFVTSRKEKWYWEIQDQANVIKLPPLPNKEKKKRVKTKESNIIQLRGGQNQS